MRVLHLITTLDRGGAENQLLALCRELVKRGEVRPTVAWLKGEGELAPEFRAAGIPATSLAAGRLRAPASILRAARLLADESPDVVHTHLFKADLLGAGLARRHGIPLFSTKHNEDPYLERLPWSAVGRRAALRARKVVAISQAVSLHVLRTLRIPASHIEVIRYGIDPAWRPEGDGAAFREGLGVSADAPLAVVPARLTKQKGLDVLIDAAAMLREEHPEFRIALVGRGEDEEALRRSVSEKGVIENVRFAGFMEDPGPAFLAADTVVLPSRWEGFGLAALEAMAGGRPVVASNVGGLPEVIGDTGTLVPPGDADRLAGALREALSPERVAAVRDGSAAEPLRAARLLADESPDVVHTHLFKADL
ncbi:MAG: glycosyltransferase, partial [Planctomycetota bacterium]